MCCSNKSREKSVVALLTIGILVSLGVSVPMFIITYPGDECILFASVRGEALVYGHPAGCHFISYSHCIVIIPTAITVFVMFLCYFRRGPKDTGSISNRSLRGSLPGLSQNSSYGIQTGVSSKLIIVVLTNAIFVLIAAIVNLSGYLVTCGQLLYETRRQVHQRTTLGLPIKNFVAECYSLYRIDEFHTRFHFDHYELSGQWRGQYQGYNHGRVHEWTGHQHLMDIPTGIELSLACSFISAIVWMALFTILLLLRRNVKAKNRRHVVESIEDARIWASDMALSNSLPMKTINYADSAHSGVSQPDTTSIGKSLGSRLSSSALYAQHKQESIGVNDMQHHQQVIAKSHPNGSMFMTQSGQYVQLINGVLTNISPPASTASSVQYAEVQFPGGVPLNQQQAPGMPLNQQQAPGMPLNQHQAPGIAYPQAAMNYPQFAMNQPQTPMNYPQNAMDGMNQSQNAMHQSQNAMHQSQNAMNQSQSPTQSVLHQIHNAMNQQQNVMAHQQNAMAQQQNGMTNPQNSMTHSAGPVSLDRVSQVSQPLLPHVNQGSHVNHVTNNQSDSRSEASMQSQSVIGQEEELTLEEKTTLRDQRNQLDIAERAGIKCSQF